MGAKPSGQKFDFVSTFKGSLGERYEIIKQLGAGAQGAAYLVKTKETQQEFVAKETHDISEDGRQEFMEEFEKMKELHHPNCSKVIELVEGRDFIDGEWKEQLYVISELAKGSDLHKYTKTVIETGVGLTEEWVAGVYKQAMMGVAYIHSKDIVHNDLKPDNILMLDAFNPREPNKVPWVVINDFGCATLQQDKFFKTGDPRYQSAETWAIILKIMAGDQQSFAKVSAKADVWSMSATLFELLSGGMLPFIYKPLSLGDIDENMWGTLGDAVTTQTIRLEEHCTDATPEAIDLMRKMFLKDPKQRLTAEEVLQHNWFEVKGKPISEVITRKLEFNATKGVAHQILLNALSAKLQRTHYNQCWKIFQSLDRDNCGDIDLEEFKAGYGKINSDMTDAAVEQLFKQADIDSSGKVDFNEFMAATFDWSSLTPKQLQANLQAMFSDLDQDNDGNVSVRELSALFRGVLPRREIEQIFKRIDVNGDNNITKDELQRFLFEPATEEEVEKYAHIEVVRPIDTRARHVKEAEVLGTCLVPVCCCIFLCFAGIFKPF